MNVAVISTQKTVCAVDFFLSSPLVFSRSDCESTCFKQYSIVLCAVLFQQYPVVAADSNLPITNPLSSKQYGHLKVVLALGSMDQVTSLRLMTKGMTSAPERPVTYLERYIIVNFLLSLTAAQSLDNMVLKHDYCFALIASIRLLGSIRLFQM
jgi:hypothetical protein